MFNQIGSILTILAIGVVIWWFVKPQSKGPAFVSGLFVDATSFFGSLIG
jgi:hypothetical protein